MNGKDKCRILKDIRRQIAEQNDIEWVVSECKHKGNCKGTCPKCESEVRHLEEALARRRKLGKVVAVAGVSAACMAGLTACSMDDVVEYGTEIVDQIRDVINQKVSTFRPDKPDRPDKPEPIELDGDVVYIPDDISGYMEYPEPETEAPDDEMITLDGEVAIDSFQMR